MRYQVTRYIRGINGNRRRSTKLQLSQIVRYFGRTPAQELTECLHKLIEDGVVRTNSVRGGLSGYFEVINDEELRKLKI